MPRLGCMTRMSTFTEDETLTITPMRTFPVIRDLVTDVSFNYAKAREIPSFTPDPSIKPGEFRMQQEDVNRSQEFRKCIECYLCQNTCHVIRDHTENEHAFSGPRFLMRVAELEMHPADEADRREHRAGRLRPRLLQHHQVLHGGLPRAHQDHRQRDHPDEGARRRAAGSTRWSGSARRSAGGRSRRARRRCPASGNRLALLALRPRRPIAKAPVTGIFRSRALLRALGHRLQGLIPHAVSLFPDTAKTLTGDAPCASLGFGLPLPFCCFFLCWLLPVLFDMPLSRRCRRVPFARCYA